MTMYVESSKLMGNIVLHKPLNHRETLFVDHCLTAKTNTEAARLAGYSSNPGSQASRLLRRERVQVAIGKARQKLAHRNSINQDAMIEMLLLAYNTADNEGNATGMRKAAREIGLLCGLYAQTDE